jgi:hypothetical protein
MHPVAVKRVLALRAVEFGSCQSSGAGVGVRLKLKLRLRLKLVGEKPPKLKRRLKRRLAI